MSSNSETTFGNKLSEVDFVKRILFEFGVDEMDLEIDRTITRVKVDIFQDEMAGYATPQK